MEHTTTQQHEVVGQGGSMVSIANLQEYKVFIQELRAKIDGLVNEGLMSSVVANRLMDDFSYNAFNSIVKIVLNQPPQ